MQLLQLVQLLKLQKNLTTAKVEKLSVFKSISSNVSPENDYFDRFVVLRFTGFLDFVHLPGF
jgi:hypothetical protein